MDTTRKILADALFAMLQAYWAENRDGTRGDGGEPPEVIVKAERALAGEIVDPIYFQDGAQFYPLSGYGRIVSYPSRVRDYDMEAAKKARSWFKEMYPTIRIQGEK